MSTVQWLLGVSPDAVPVIAGRFRHLLCHLRSEKNQRSGACEWPASPPPALCKKPSSKSRSAKPCSLAFLGMESKVVKLFFNRAEGQWIDRCGMLLTFGPLKLGGNIGNVSLTQRRKKYKINLLKLLNASPFAVPKLEERFAWRNLLWMDETHFAPL